MNVYGYVSAPRICDAIALQVTRDESNGMAMTIICMRVYNDTPMAGHWSKVTTDHRLCPVVILPLSSCEPVGAESVVQLLSRPKALNSVLEDDASIGSGHIAVSSDSAASQKPKFIPGRFGALNGWSARCLRNRKLPIVLSDGGIAPGRPVRASCCGVIDKADCSPHFTTDPLQSVSILNAGLLLQLACTARQSRVDCCEKIGIPCPTIGEIPHDTSGSNPPLTVVQQKLNRVGNDLVRSKCCRDWVCVFWAGAFKEIMDSSHKAIDICIEGLPWPPSTNDIDMELP